MDVPSPPDIGAKVVDPHQNFDEEEVVDPNHVYSDWHLLPDLLLETIFQYLTLSERHTASQLFLPYHSELRNIQLSPLLNHPYHLSLYICTFITCIIYLSACGLMPLFPPCLHNRCATTGARHSTFHVSGIRLNCTIPYSLSASLITVQDGR
ncbi:hypothetical protein E2C01_068328 [Portunus trituberculatus]|uniref:F-box domain-containing protein n=1 Tax=Portunus trituberculatus TaxID=210409 RepID=A0A5B7HZR1_PORTR|nr:hypothetical protein [Portunus trituberculatus]